MSTPDAVAAFMRITGAPEFVAVRKLEEYGGNLNEAVNAHFLEVDRHILSGQGQNLAAAPQYANFGASNQSRDRGSNGIFPFLNAARRFRPSLLLDPNYRRELKDLYNGIGGSTTFTSRPPPLTSHPAEVTEIPGGINSAFSPHYQSGLSTTGADTTGHLLSHGLGIRGTDGHQNEYPLAQSNASHVPDTEIEDAMLQAAIEASKMESRGDSSWEQIGVLNDSSDGGLPQGHIQQEDDDLSHAIMLSLKTAEQEKAIRELLTAEEKEGLGLHNLLDKGKKINSSRSQLELGTSSDQNVAQDVAQSVTGHLSNHSAGGHSQRNEDVFLADKWGGISSEELNEALLAETALFGEISNHTSQNFSSLPNLQHPEKNVDPNTQCFSTSMSQLLNDSRLLKQQQDAAYLESLRADKQKELNSLNKAESHSSKEEVSSKNVLEKKELGKMLDKKEVRLSKEPPVSDEVITIVVRMPDGGRCERRFLKNDKLELLFDFVDICGAQKPGTYRLLSVITRLKYKNGAHSRNHNHNRVHYTAPTRGERAFEIHRASKRTMAMPPPDAIVTFMQITGVPEYVAVQKLQEHQGNLNDAINGHFIEVERPKFSGLCNQNTLAQSSTSHVPEAQTEEQIFQAAIEALNTLSQGKKMKTGEGSSSQQMGILKDSSGGGLPQSHSPQEDDNDLALARAIWASIKDNDNDDIEPLAVAADVLNELDLISEDETEELTKKVLRDPAKETNLIAIAVRMPSGRRIDRFFYKTDTLKELFESVDIVGFDEVKSGSYRLVKLFPRRAYSVEDGSLTFEEVGLIDDVALYIEKI